VIAVYRGWREIDDPFNPKQKRIRYVLEVDGQEKYFDNNSVKLMLVFDTIAIGEMVKIMKKVEGKKIRYYAEPYQMQPPVKPAEPPKPPEKKPLPIPTDGQEDVDPDDIPF
jgi:hypothetical protein